VLGSFIEQDFCSTHAVILSNLSSVKYGKSWVYQSLSNVDPLALLQLEQQHAMFDRMLWPPLCFGKM
jgi:hypothetical protein|tara:strand:- start:652 stop:852 length:201 start_codon:yes stop_codon:yes gene_type:complete